MAVSSYNFVVDEAQNHLWGHSSVLVQKLRQSLLVKLRRVHRLLVHVLDIRQVYLSLGLVLCLKDLCVKLSELA